MLLGSAAELGRSPRGRSRPERFRGSECSGATSESASAAVWLALRTVG
jgi:hypothetical protein